MRVQVCRTPARMKSAKRLLQVIRTTLPWRCGTGKSRDEAAAFMIDGIIFRKQEYLMGRLSIGRLGRLLTASTRQEF